MQHSWTRACLCFCSHSIMSITLKRKLLGPFFTKSLPRIIPCVTIYTIQSTILLVSCLNANGRTATYRNSQHTSWRFPYGGSRSCGYWFTVEIEWAIFGLRRIAIDLGCLEAEKSVIEKLLPHGRYLWNFGMVVKVSEMYDSALELTTWLC